MKRGLQESALAKALLFATCVVFAAFAIVLLMAGSLPLAALAITGTGGTITLNTQADSLSYSGSEGTITSYGTGGMTPTGNYTDAATIFGRFGILTAPEQGNNSAPTIQLNSPASGIFVTATQVYLNYTVFDADNDFVNCTILAANSTPPAGTVNASSGLANATTVTYLFSQLNQTTYFWQVNCTDGQENTISGIRNFTVDSIAPSLSILSPLNKSYNTASVLVNLSSSGAANLWFFNGTANETYSAEITRTFAEGQRTLIAYANDTAGNFNQTSVSFGIDLTVPATITGLTNISQTNSSITWNWSNPGTADFNGTVLYIDGSNLINLSAADHNYTATGFTQNTSHTITVNTMDTSRNVNTTNVTHTAFTLPSPDGTPPAITLISPANNSGFGSRTVAFLINTSDESSLANCSIYIDGTLNVTNSSFTTGNVSSFIVQGMNISRHTWNVSCTDVVGNTRMTPAYSFSIATLSGFNGNTTNITLFNMSAITNLTLENTTNGMVQFTGTMDLSNGSDLAQHVTMLPYSMIVNSSLEPQLNRSARVSMYNIAFSHPLILKDGAVCNDCTLLSVAGGTVLFNVTGFSNYTITSTSRLYVYDDTDFGAKYIGEQVTFYANYSNRTSGEPIAGNCTVSFTFPGLSSPVNMTYNPGIQLHTYNRSFNASGGYTFNVSCFAVAPGFDNLSAVDSFTITPPLSTHSDNYENVTVITQVNVTNSRPEILAMRVYDSATGSPINVTLSAGSQRLLQCNATVRDRNGMDGNITMNATLFHQAISSFGAADDNSSHYSLDCTNSTAAYGQNGWYKNFTCGFNVWYYASNGTWNCTINVIDVKDSLNYSIFASNLTSIFPLYALNITNGIDYGEVAVTEYSRNATANITNFGNNPINVTVQGYGAVPGDNFAFICNSSVAETNISIGSEAFSLNPLANFTQKTALTGGVQPVAGLTMTKPTDATRLLFNATYWQIYLDPAENPSGVCTGNVIFAARMP